jgi:CubicO group peptidase (beta-lactamase class C family)
MKFPSTAHGTVLISGDAQAAGMDQVHVQRTVQLAANWVTDGTTPALIVLAAREGVVFLHEAFGRLTPEADSPALPPNAIYPVASISKPVTATAVLCLVEDGLLKLDRAVQAYVTEFTGDGKEAVTLQHLLTHTSGLRDEAVEAHVRSKLKSGAIPPDGRTEPASLALFPPYVTYWHFDAGLDAPLSGRPGQAMAYSSYGYALLGKIVARVSGRAFADFCHERIFVPLGMHDTYFEVPEAQWPRVVRRPTSFPPQHLNVRERIPAAMPQGGLSSVAWDLAVLGQTFLNGGNYDGAHVLTAESVEQMTHNQVPRVMARRDGGGETSAQASSGLGWMVHVPGAVRPLSRQLSDDAFGHAGSGGSLLCVDPARDLVVVWLSVSADQSSTNEDLFIDALVESVVH